MFTVLRPGTNNEIRINCIMFLTCKDRDKKGGLQYVRIRWFISISDTLGKTGAVLCVHLHTSQTN
jgi:hypothetical protein